MAMSEEEREEKNKARGKAWHIANKERLVAVRKAYWAANKEHLAAIEKAWRDANKERVDFYKIRFELKSQYEITNPPEGLVNLIIANRKLKRVIREVS